MLFILPAFTILRLLIVVAKKTTPIISSIQSMGAERREFVVIPCPKALHLE
jgi:hypothetical protein